MRGIETSYLAACSKIISKSASLICNKIPEIKVPLSCMIITKVRKYIIILSL